MCLNGFKFFSLGFAILPGLESYKEECVIGSPDKAEQTKADDARGVLNSRGVCEYFFHLPGGITCAFHGRRIAQRHSVVEVALMFIRQEAGSQMTAKEPG